MAESRIGNYEVAQVLGVGTVGTVYKARDVDTGQPVALKVLLPDVSHHPLIKARFKREMEILSELNHPNMIRYLGGGKLGDQLYYAMELLESGTVKELLTATGPFTWQEAAECGRAIAAALQHAHNNSIIHRDLKPSNLFITGDGRLRLGDFGIARDLRAEDLTLAGVTVGTYAYMAPEQIRGERDITGKSDLYSLGCVLYEMLTGRVPFLGANFHEIVEQHLKSSHVPVRRRVAHCPVEFSDLIDRLLEKDPEKRPFNARAVQGELNELLRKKVPGYSIAQDAEEATSFDVGAGQVVPDLRHRLRRKRLKTEVSWGKLIAAATVLAVVITIIALFTST